MDSEVLYMWKLVSVLSALPRSGQLFLPSDCWNGENEARLRVGVK